MADYIVTVYTGEIDGGGTDADVFIWLYGANGNIGPFELDTKDHDDFEVGENDSYRIRNVQDVGAIKQIYIAHNNKGSNPSWYLDGVTVRNVSTGRGWYFPANRWLARDKRDGKTGIYLQPGERQVHYDYICNYPKDRENGWSEEMNGVCHDKSNWFFTQDGNLWKFPVSHNLNDKCTKPGNGILKISTKYHLGDIDHYCGYIFVPISDGTPRIAAYRASDLQMVATTYVKKSDGTYLSSCGWVAINPKSGLLYTSDKHVNQNSPVLIYKIDLDALKNAKSEFLSFHAKLTLRDNDNTILKREHMQGGCFDNENHLHISNGYYTVKGSQNYANSKGGISVFKVAERPAMGSNENVVRLTRSNQSHDFRYQFNGTGDEPEGITYWDLDREATAPKITGQLHAIMLNNVGTGDDDFYFKHYRRV